MITPRENLLRTLCCEAPQWIPVTPYLFPNENPITGIPEKLKDFFRISDAYAILGVGEYLGAEDFILPAPSPAVLVSDTCPIKTEQIEKGKFISTMFTPKGELCQITEIPEGQPALTVERYIKTVDDLIKLTEYFASLKIELIPENIKKIKDLKNLLGDRGIIFYRTFGTPLGMCYRVYSDITNLIYMIMDEPELVENLFTCMEEKYFKFYEFVLQEVPEIDALFAMDDTSTTLISPDMFAFFNVELTNRRADLCHKYGKIYMHHSCGLIHDLLPMYRKTRMNGIDAFTVPPIGNVGYMEGREILGPEYSINTLLADGLPSLDRSVMRKQVVDRMKDAKIANNVTFFVGGSHLTFPAMEYIFTEAQRLKATG